MQTKATINHGRRHIACHHDVIRYISTPLTLTHVIRAKSGPVAPSKDPGYFPITTGTSFDTTGSAPSTFISARKWYLPGAAVLKRGSEGQIAEIVDDHSKCEGCKVRVTASPVAETSSFSQALGGFPVRREKGAQYSRLPFAACIGFSSREAKTDRGTVSCERIVTTTDPPSLAWSQLDVLD